MCCRYSQTLTVSMEIYRKNMEKLYQKSYSWSSYSYHLFAATTSRKRREITHCFMEDVRGLNTCSLWSSSSSVSGWSSAVTIVWVVLNIFLTYILILNNNLQCFKFKITHIISLLPRRRASAVRSRVVFMEEVRGLNTSSLCSSSSSVSGWSSAVTLDADRTE